MESRDRVWLITGCSTGLGRALAETVLERGERVAVTARRAETVADIAAKHGARARTFALDVTDEHQVKAAVADVLAAFGGIDVVVNNAGYGLVGTIEDTGDAQAKRMFETNLFGTLNVIRAVVPAMRERRAGHVINVSSAAGRAASPPMLGLYSASKHAVGAISESLAAEVAPFGVKVTVVEPGAFATNFRNSLDVVKPSAPYAGLAQRLKQGIAMITLGDPRHAAGAIVRAADSSDPPLRLVLGERAAGGMRAALERQIEELARWLPFARLADRGAD
jgi:NAD(P)-dependent dehydrogenase (short-subunit alcohol dehydrogenase family)